MSRIKNKKFIIRISSPIILFLCIFTLPNFYVNSRKIIPHANAQTTDATKSVTLIGAGDAGRCDRLEDNQTAKIVSDVLASKPSGTARVYYGGDVYEDGTAAEMQNCYGGSEYGLPAWGSFKDQTWPIIGDHELHTNNGAP